MNANNTGDTTLISLGFVDSVKKKSRTMNASEMQVCIEVLVDWCDELEQRIMLLEGKK